MCIGYCVFISPLTILFMTDPREPSTVKSMVWIWSGTHMLPTLWSTVPTKLMVCWLTSFVHETIDFFLAAFKCLCYEWNDESMIGSCGELVRDVSLSFHCDVCNCCAAHPEPQHQLSDCGKSVFTVDWGSCLYSLRVRDSAPILELTVQVTALPTVEPSHHAHSPRVWCILRFYFPPLLATCNCVLIQLLRFCSQRHHQVPLPSWQQIHPLLSWSQ